METLAAALLVLLLALPASAGELIRYRTPDGSIGFVDDEKRLPAGVEVISRSPLDPPPAPAAPPETDEAEPEAAPGASGGEAAVADEPEALADDEPAACEDLGDLRERTGCWRDRAERCDHYGLRSRCAAEEIASAEQWCARGDELRAELPALDEAHGEAQERIEACKRSGGIRPDCESGELEDADRALRDWERRMEALEEQCQAEECLPGWVRERCGFEPTS